MQDFGTKAITAASECDTINEYTLLLERVAEVNGDHVCSIDFSPTRPVINWQVLTGGTWTPISGTEGFFFTSAGETYALKAIPSGGGYNGITFDLPYTVVGVYAPAWANGNGRITVTLDSTALISDSGHLLVCGECTQSECSTTVPPVYKNSWWQASSKEKWDCVEAINSIIGISQEVLDINGGVTITGMTKVTPTPLVPMRLWVTSPLASAVPVTVTTHPYFKGIGGNVVAFIIHFADGKSVRTDVDTVSADGCVNCEKSLVEATTTPNTTNPNGYTVCPTLADNPLGVSNTVYNYGSSRTIDIPVGETTGSQDTFSLGSGSLAIPDAAADNQGAAFVRSDYEECADCHVVIASGSASGRSEAQMHPTTAAVCNWTFNIQVHKNTHKGGYPTFYYTFRFEITGFELISKTNVQNPTAKDVGVSWQHYYANTRFYGWDAVRCYIFPTIFGGTRTVLCNVSLDYSYAY